MNTYVKNIIVRLIPNKIRPTLRAKQFRMKGGSYSFWENVYANGGNSGEGSYGKLAQFKAEIIRQFISEKSVGSVIELGCGDGNQVGLSFDDGVSYLGLDVSKTAISQCIERFKEDKNKDFFQFDVLNATNKQGFLTADLAVSIDVIYHLIEDYVYERYMEMLFGLSKQYIIIYSPDIEQEQKPSYPHEKSRKFTEYINANFPEWELVQHIPNKYPVEKDPSGSSAEFYFFERGTKAGSLPDLGKSPLS